LNAAKPIQHTYYTKLGMVSIQAQVLEWYGVEVSPQLISNVTDAVMDEGRQWQNRPLEEVYPIMYVDCLVRQPCEKTSAS
jgi:transposase-like protein